MTTKKADYIWFNGEMVPWAEAKVHVMSHALHYGTSVFEGCAATIPTMALQFSVTVSICSACATPPRSIACQFPTALMN